MEGSRTKDKNEKKIKNNAVMRNRVVRTVPIRNNGLVWPGTILNARFLTAALFSLQCVLCFPLFRFRSNRVRNIHSLARL